MGLLDKFRKSQENTTAMKAERIRTVIGDVMSSDAAMLSLLNNTNNNIDFESLVTDMTEKIVDSVCNPVNDFLDICRNKNISEEKIVDFVHHMNLMFGLCDESATYDDKLASVAKYFAENPRMYDDLSLFR